MKDPQPMGMVFCDGFDPQSLSLSRLFQGTYFKSFPVIASPFMVYSALYSSGNEGTLQLKCVRLETERNVYSYSTWRDFLLGQSCSCCCLFSAFDSWRRGDTCFDCYLTNVS